MALGATPMRPGEDPRAWLAGALAAAGARRLRHGGNLRYAFAVGTRSERRRVDLALEALPYPKATDDPD